MTRETTAARPQVNQRSNMSKSISIALPQPTNLLGRVLSLFFMDRGLWSAGSVLIGSLASVMGIAWGLTTCASVCAVAATSLLIVTIRQPAKTVRGQEQPIQHIEPDIM